MAYLIVAALVLLGFLYAAPAPEGSFDPGRIPVLASLPGDLPGYAWRFILSFFLLGAFPLLTALLCGEQLRDLGVRLPQRPFATWLWIPIALLSLATAAGGAYTAGTAHLYPYSKTLVLFASSRSAWYIALHAVIYLLAYYVPWEFFFRGFLLFPLVRLAESRDPGQFSVPLALASIQAIPSAMLHVGHPAVETFGAVGFGVAAAYLALRSRSILPGLAIHAGIGILQDLLIILRSAGSLP